MPMETLALDALVYPRALVFCLVSSCFFTLVVHSRQVHSVRFSSELLETRLRKYDFVHSHRELSIHPRIQITKNIKIRGETR